MNKNLSRTNLLLFSFLFSVFVATSAQSEEVVTWDPKLKKLKFNLLHLSGELNFNNNKVKSHYSSHHFSNVIHKPSKTLISPDGTRMKHLGLLNFFRVLTSGGYLSELRAEESLVKPEKAGVTLTWLPTIRRQAKVIIKFT